MKKFRFVLFVLLLVFVLSSSAFADSNNASYSVGVIS